MPTGYTAAIKDGISFQTFALNCARAFGACVELRDEPGGGEMIPAEFKPNDYHLKALDAARASLAELESMSPAEWDLAAAKEYHDAETWRVKRLREIGEQHAAYERMLAAVKQWAPPTAEHNELHEFMLAQIDTSIRHDCDTSYHERPTRRRSGAEWAADRKRDLERDIKHHTKGYAEDVARAEARTAWVKALRESLSPPASAGSWAP